MELFSRIATFTATIVLGLSAGAMLAEVEVLVPYWRGLAPEAFLLWYGEHAALLVDFFAPLQISGAVLAIAAAGGDRLGSRKGGGALLAAALFSVAVLILFPLYFKDVNASFAQATISVAAIPEELARWELWQWLRTAIGGASFACAVWAVGRVSR